MASERLLNPRRVRLLWLILLLAAYALRVVRLDRLGLAYDEAATALMSRADAGAIIGFHWTAAFEHPPVWVLLMAAWTRLAGQSEFALRYLPALAGVVLVALVGGLAHKTWPAYARLGLWSGTLVASAPVLVYYSQEARMYTLVVALALGTVLLAARLHRQFDPLALGAFWLLNWIMLGLHYYAVLVPGVLALALIADGLVRPASSRPWARLSLAFFGAVLPLAGWLLFAPSFRETLTVVMTEAGTTGVTWSYFLSDLWRELSFGSIRWLPPQARLGFVLIPLVAAGAILALAPDRTTSTRWLRWFVVAAVFLPVFSAAAFLRTLSPRYILYVVPLLYVLAGLAIVRAARMQRAAGVVLLLLALGVNTAGLLHYFGPYRKSDYRTMVQRLVTLADPATDLVVLEAPRQHLLARYYLPSDWTFETVPGMELSPYWPVTAPTVVPEDEDNRIQAWLRTHRNLWVVFAGEAEVDAGEFLAKYLDAVSYPVDCDRLLDVRLCQYRSPHSVMPALTTTPALVFGRELALEQVGLSIEPDSGADGQVLLAELDWHALAQPSLDYKVSLRLVDTADRTIPLAQSDQLPIGTLLPPTTWAGDDRKPGYMVLRLPADIRPGSYELDLTLYDAATLEVVPVTQNGEPAVSPLVLAKVEVDDTIALMPVR